ncbi:MAG TPA: hypothetical protein VGM07_12265 [Stellaceae bacterium]|jgi:hypothetical protein
MPRNYREPEYRRRIRQQAEHNQQRADDERHRAAESVDIEKIVVAINTIDEKYDRETHKEHTRKKWDRRWEVMGVIGLWGAAIVGVAAVWVGNSDSERQRKVMQGQLVSMQSASQQTDRTIAALTAQANVMRGQLDEMEITRRPWVTATFGAGPLTMSDGSVSLPTTIILRNTGQTPAISVHLDGEGYAIFVPDIAAKTATICARAGRGLPGGSVFPGDTPTLRYTFEIPKTRLDNLWKEDPKLRSFIFPLLIVCIAYTEFGQPTIHHTPFMFEYRTNNMRGLRTTDMPIQPQYMAFIETFLGGIPPD